MPLHTPRARVDGSFQSRPSLAAAAAAYTVYNVYTYLQERVGAVRVGRITLWKIWNKKKKQNGTEWEGD